MSSAFTSSHDPLRRRLLMALALSPLLGSLPGRAADVPPDIARVAALEWLPIELLLALGVTPLAVADVHNYNLGGGAEAAGGGGRCRPAHRTQS